MKNLFFALASALVAVLSCACDSPESTVEKFYDALYDGNFEKAKLYCSEGAGLTLDAMNERLTGEGSEEALKQYRKDMAFEKRYFRLLTADEVEYQKKQEQKDLEEAEKQKKEKESDNKKMTKDELEALAEAEAKEKAEKEALSSASIVYARWSRDIVLKHYLLFQDGRWQIVKIEHGYPLPEKLTGDN